MTTARTAVLPLTHHYADTLGELAVPWQAEPAPDPRLVVLNEALAAELGLDVEVLRSPDGIAALIGADAGADARPVAQAYGGHQFGSWNPHLGDGRALLLGELGTPGGRRVDVQLKGSGRTPFARNGDGRAQLGPMLREYVVSESMAALGIPTTRALAVLTTGHTVRRTTSGAGAVLVRVAAGGDRIGTVQLAAASGNMALLRRLVDYALDRYHPAAPRTDNPAADLLRAVVAAQASLIADWMSVGFLHGVMNTDNMTLSGETLDFGPCAFLEAYDPETVFSSIDHGGRYRFGHQPHIAVWNLSRLAEALLPLLDDPRGGAESARGEIRPETVELAQDIVGGFGEQYAGARRDRWAAKLGLAADLPTADLDRVIDDLQAMLVAAGADLTSTMRAIGASAGDPDATPEGLGDLTRLPEWEPWSQRWRDMHPDQSLADATNPIYLPRNHLVEEALAAADAGDLGPLTRLVDAVRHPYDLLPNATDLAEPGPAEFTAGYQTFCGT